MCDEEEVFADNVGSEEDTRFDSIVNALEEVLMSGSFTRLQSKFCQQYVGVFEDKDENKLEYHGIFERYMELVEAHLEESLSRSVQDFSMAEFSGMLAERQDETTGDVFDLMLALSDFEEFKQMMLAYKRGDALGIELDGRRGEGKSQHK